MALRGMRRGATVAGLTPQEEWEQGPVTLDDLHEHQRQRFSPHLGVAGRRPWEDALDRAFSDGVHTPLIASGETQPGPVRDPREGPGSGQEWTEDPLADVRQDLLGRLQEQGPGAAPERPEFPSWGEIVGPGSGAAGGAAGASIGGGGSVAGMQHVEEAQANAAEALASLDRLFEDRKQALRERYQLEETPEEQANIQHLMDIIEVQQEQGTQVIERVYGDAVDDAHRRAEEMAARGEDRAARTQERFDSAAQETADLQAALSEQFGGAMGVAAEELSPVARAASGDLAARGADEAAFDDRMFGVSEGDIAAAGEAMRPEMLAQVGALQGQAAQTAAMGQFQHDQSVQNRVAQERMAYNQALADLAAQMDQRRFGLQDQQTDLSLQASQLQSAGADRRLQSQMGLTPEQEFALQRAEMEHEAAMRDYERQQQEHALRSMGLDTGAAGAAAGLGIGPQTGESLLQQRLGLGGIPPEMMQMLQQQE